MQELIDEMTKYLDLHESPEVKEVLRILKASAIRKYWKKEKEQIIDAMERTAMYVSAASLDKEIGKMTFEDLYNQTFNK